MGYLDELKAKAAALSARQRSDDAEFERRARATDAACRTTFRYWLELVRQLEVLRPPVPGRDAFDARHVLDGVLDHLCFEDFTVDERRTRLRDLDVCDHVVVGSWVRGRRRMVIDKDFPTEMERLEARLAQAGMPAATPEMVRDGPSGKTRFARYEFEADVHVGVRLVPEHAEGRVRFAVQNFESLATVVVEFAAEAVDADLLDELAKWWLGEPNRFLSNGRIVRRIEPL